MSPSAPVPYVIFKSAKPMNDYLADDMRYGDLNETQLKEQFNLKRVSSRLNPYTQEKYIFNPHGAVANSLPSERLEKLSTPECVKLLFDEFRSEARHLTLLGKLGSYSDIIQDMISHMQYKNGAPYGNALLNQALKIQILNDIDREKSSLLAIKAKLLDQIDWTEKKLKSTFYTEAYRQVGDSVLPKFNSIKDIFNGLGITVHDIHTVHITLKSFRIEGDQYFARVHYQAQDHFGLDKIDILKQKFHHFDFFRVWFVLQRYNKFAFKPFMTNMEAMIEINGSRYD